MARKRSLPSGNLHPPAKRARTSAKKVTSKAFVDLTRPRVFRFLDLPAELRRVVYQSLIPHDLFISFEPQSTSNSYDETRWVIFATNRLGTESRAPMFRLGSRLCQTQLFVLNKFISNEAKAVLYGENTFVFRVDGDSHRPKSLESPRIFGVLGHSHRIHLLRNIRSISILMGNSSTGKVTHWVAKRHRARLEYFIRILKEHADDENQRSLLERLTVQIDWKPSPKLMYNLESLTGLRGIQDVDIQAGGIPEWYAKCLQLCIEGNGGDLQPIDYPLVLRQKSKKSNAPRRRPSVQIWETTKLWHDPVFNWEEFADRNGIDRPQLHPVDLTGDSDIGR
ncbi:hypothetical protein K491DRAFT_698552 [Lophiostoma macrostomum CBS 122681]|uniref:F-box domain-containing protein n=1 Tax=Lophiostoma macrostomum CBS 122681 TaxID=1314788 RepID=A0A6A6SRQ9_9PLEO|nr:hypothetical protein K491DRAFT_698552 [Lophiostoma macrostomum CBS 122681]